MSGFRAVWTRSQYSNLLLKARRNAFGLVMRRIKSEDDPRIQARHLRKSVQTLVRPFRFERDVRIQEDLQRTCLDARVNPRIKSGDAHDVETVDAGSALLRRPDGQFCVRQSVDSADQMVSWHDRADARWRSRIDDIAGTEMIERREVCIIGQRGASDARASASR
jgi:malate synthase